MVVDGGFEVLKSTGVDLAGEVGGDGFFGKSISQFISSDSDVARYPTENDGLCIGFEAVYLVVDFSGYTVGLVDI